METTTNVYDKTGFVMVKKIRYKICLVIRYEEIIRNRWDARRGGNFPIGSKDY
jgi:hypothetical protein